MKYIMHLDIDAFFPTAATILDPNLKNIPLAISSGSSRTVVASASYEARKFGIKAGTPVFKARKALPNLVIVNPNFNFYYYLSELLFKYLKDKYTKNIEIASIDECYLDFTNIIDNWLDFKKKGYEIQNNVYKKFKLNVSLGLSFNKFTAKMATNLKKPNGISIIKPENFKKKLWHLSIDKFFGIGKENSKKLLKINIKTIGNFALLKPSNPYLKEIFGKNVKHFINLANGIGKDSIDTNEPKFKIISNSSTFPNEDIEIREEIIKWLKKYCIKISQRAILRNLVGYKVGVFIRYSGSIKKRISINTTISIKDPISNANDIYDVALALFDKKWTGNSVRAIGVSLGNLKNKYDITHQQNIFDISYNNEKHIPTIIRKINYKFRNEILMTAAKKNNMDKNKGKIRSGIKSHFSNKNAT